ncbi:MAG: hydrolase [Tepidisphaeraceae bacterium]|jgi:glutamate carboxypeptidase
MQQYRPILNSIAAQQSTLLRRLTDWSKINSFTENPAGVAMQIDAISKVAANLGGEMKILNLPPWIGIDARGVEKENPVGPALSVIKRPDAPLHVFLCIHADTVYPKNFPAEVRGEKLFGPGVADAKGGLVVMLAALEALEQSPFASRIGWEMLVNPDEEIGSPSSADLFTQAASRNDFGLLFEPALPDGALVDRRKGSGHFSLIVRGKSAHAGRDFASGRSALVAAADAVLKLHALNSARVTVNIGSIDGGGPANVVPDLAIVRINCRTTEIEDEMLLRNGFDRVVAELNQRDGITAELHGKFAAPPKILSPANQALLDSAVIAARDLGMNIATRPSGGTCDGNRLAKMGLPNIDSLGVVGGNLHSPDEYMEIPSLVHRAQIATLLLLRLAEKS